MHPVAEFVAAALGETGADPGRSDVSNWMEKSVMPKSHERLHVIAGRWATDGHVVGDPSLPVKGFDTYDVLAGGYFLVHHVEVTVGDQPVQAIEVIGERDPDSDGFLARSFDNSGNCEVMRVSWQTSHALCSVTAALRVIQVR